MLNLPFKAGQRLLEVGGGENPLIRPNLDVRRLPTVDLVGDLSERWPVEDASYDGVLARYVLEHISWRKTRHFISELWRILAPGGRAIIITANAEAQMRWALSREEWDEKISQCLGGEQDYPENTHRAYLNPDYARKLFREGGFTDIGIFPFGETSTDMWIEVVKPMPQQPRVDLSTADGRRSAFDRLYFDGGRGPAGGYVREGYWDYPCHWVTFRKIMERKPESVLELGCGRGYILKRLQDAGIQKAVGLEISEHCWHTRVCEGIQIWDLTKVPWPFRDQEFDLVYDIATLEHIPEEHIERVIGEIRRVGHRGLHGIDFGDKDDGTDKTHVLLRPREWWVSRFGSGQEVLSKEDLESGPPDPPGPDGLIKLNLGSFRVMFHYGWVNIDVLDLNSWAQTYGYIFRQWDLSKGIPYPDGSVDLVYVSHLLEHFDFEGGFKLVSEIRRVLRPDGVLRISTPDLQRLCQEYVAGRLGIYDHISDECAACPELARKFMSLLLSGGHRMNYDRETLDHLLRRAGFAEISFPGFRESRSEKMKKETLDMFPTLSLFAEAR